MVDHDHQSAKGLVLNFIPDGKTKTMSSISHKLDAKESAKGKGQADVAANKSEMKKQADASAAGGEEEKLSKKQLAKMAKKEKKQKAKTEAKEAGAEEEKKD